MAKAKQQTSSTHVQGAKKITTIGRRNIGFSTMNKSKRRSFKAYNRQGK